MKVQLKVGQHQRRKIEIKYNNNKTWFYLGSILWKYCKKYDNKRLFLLLTIFLIIDDPKIASNFIRSDLYKKRLNKEK